MFSGADLTVITVLVKLVVITIAILVVFV